MNTRDLITLFKRRPMLVDTYTKIALPMNGPNLGTSFVDLTGKSWTPAGGAVISTAQSVMGGASGYFDGDAYISMSAHTDLNVGSGEFTLDFWFRRTQVVATERICGQCDEWNNTASRAWWVQVAANGVVLFSVMEGTTTYQIWSNTLFPDTNWHHLIGGRDVNTLRLLVDADVGSTADLTGVTVNSSIYDMSIGRQGERAADYFGGYVDHFRFDKGIYRVI